MRIFDIIPALRERNQLLYYGGILNIILFAVFLSLSLIDQRQVLGINTWIKPMKFCLSFVIFLWTFAWILHYLPHRKKTKWISIGLFICMLVEITTISLQAARGQPSHYNVSSVFNIIVFQLMGMFIFLNTIIVIYIIIQFFKPGVVLEPYMKTAVQGGLLIFILGALSGGLMVGLGSHSIGASDGGDGLFFLNWNISAGDLRVAHFFSLHALQFVPLIVWVLSKSLGESQTLPITVSLLYSAFCFLLHVQALSGSPFLAL
jgi:hypothetical protein